MCSRATAPIRSCCAFRPDRPPSRKCRCRSEGHIDEAFTDPRTPGVTLDLSSLIAPPPEFAYHPANKTFSDLKIGAHGDFVASDYSLSDLQAKAADGTMVPLSLVQPKSAKGAQITIIEAYGSYGISELADFSVRRAAAMREGITYGVCHVRGGGELGEPWRLGGKDANKHNTWGDLIACGEYLIARGVTTPRQAVHPRRIGGRHHHGALIDGAAGSVRRRASIWCPRRNTLRAEFSADGPANIPEFGSITTAAGLQQSVRDGHHPARQEGDAVSRGDGHHGTQRSARLALGTGQVGGRAAGLGHDETRAAAHRRGGRPRDRLDQDAERRAQRGCHCLRVLARRAAGVAAQSAALEVQHGQGMTMVGGKMIYDAHLLRN